MKNSKNSGIYKITNIKNNKFYIGSSKQLKRRFWEHKNDLNKNKHVNNMLQNAWNKYGGKSFTFEILENVPEDRLLIVEQSYIDKFDPCNRNIGYNLSPIVGGGDNFTNHPNKEEILKNIKRANNVNHMHGKKHREESKQLQREKAKGRFSLEWFIERNGEEEGRKKYNARREKLKNRKINYSHKSSEFIKRQPMEDAMKNKISAQRKYIPTIKNKLIKDIELDEYTIAGLAEKYNISMTTVKYYKRKLRN